VADSLATEARTSPTITYYRDASTSLDNVALTNKQGGLIEAGLKKRIEHKHSTHRESKQRMHRSRGEYFRDKRTDYAQSQVCNTAEDTT